MSGIEKRLDKIEDKIDLVIQRASFPSFNPTEGSEKNGEVDLRDLGCQFWHDRYWVLGIVCLCCLLGFLYLSTLPLLYRSEGIYVLSQNQSESSSLSSKFGGIASVAGVTLGGGRANDIDQAMVLIKSWPFLESVINKYNLKPLVMGVNGCDPITQELTWDRDVYDPNLGVWTIDQNQPSEVGEPTSFEVYRKFKSMISASYDTKTSMLSISIEFYSPKLAKEWVDLLVEHVNESFRIRDTSRSKKNIGFLKKKINETSISEMKIIFYNMIEDQTRTLMLAEVSNEYLVRSVVPTMVPEKLSKQQKQLLFLMIVILSAGLSMLFVFVRYLFTSSNTLGIDK